MPMLPSRPMGRAKGAAPGQIHPKGPLITIPADLPATITAYRAAHGLTQGAFASKVKLSQGAISNIESGAATQVRRTVLARIQRVLRIEASASDSDGTDDAFTEAVESLVYLDAEQLRAVAQMTAALKKAKKPR